MEFILANGELILAIIIAVNALLARIPAIAENDIFQIIGTILKGLASKSVTPVK